MTGLVQPSKPHVAIIVTQEYTVRFALAGIEPAPLLAQRAPYTKGGP